MKYPSGVVVILVVTFVRRHCSCDDDVQSNDVHERKDGRSSYDVWRRSAPRKFSESQPTPRIAWEKVAEATPELDNELSESPLLENPLAFKDTLRSVSEDHAPDRPLQTAGSFRPAVLKNQTDTARKRSELHSTFSTPRRRFRRYSSITAENWFEYAKRKFPEATMDNLIRKGFEEFCSYFPNSDHCAVCHKDDDCGSYGDCCLSKLPSPSSSPTPSAPPSPLRCPELRGSYHSFYMVATCNSTTAPPETVERCLRPVAGEWEDENPVTDDSTGLTYRNSFCAACNGVVSFSPWSVEVDCGKKASPLREASSALALYERVARTGECKLHYFPRGFPRTCTPPTPSLVSSCGPLETYWMRRDPRVVRACDSHVSVVMRRYKNVFCYWCNQRKSWRELILSTPGSTMSLESPIQVHLTAILTLRPIVEQRTPADSGNVYESRTSTDGSSGQHQSMDSLVPKTGGSGKDQQRQCPDNQGWDPHQCTCRELLCAPGKTMDKQACRSIFSTTLNSYRLCLLLQTSMRTTSSFAYREFMYKVKNHIYTSSDFPNTEVTEIKVLGFSHSCNQSVVMANMTVSLRILPAGPIAPDEFEENLLTRLGRPAFDSQSEYVRVSFQDFGRCGHRSTREETEMSCTLHEVPMFASERRRVPFYLEQVDKLSTVLDLTPLLTCSQVELHMDEIVYSREDEVIHVLASNASLNSSVFSLSNHSVKVCYEEYIRGALSECPGSLVMDGNTGGGDFNNNSDNSSEYISREHLDSLDYLGVLSVVCSTLSLVFLAVCLVLYCVHRQLRTVVGYQKMAMIASFWLALGLFEFGVEQNEDATVCIVIGVLCHYLWLLATFWMNVCTGIFFYQVVFPFSARIKLQSKTRVCIWTSLYSLGCPALIVGSNVGCNWAIHGDLGYGGRICYIKASRALSRQLALGLPIGVIVLLNLTLFLVAIVTVKTRPRLLHVSHQSKVGLFSCLRLSLITGALWMLAFLSEAWRSVVLEYLFTLTFGLYGLFIFLDLLLLLRSRGLLCGRSSNLESLGKQGTASISASHGEAETKPAGKSSTDCTASTTV